jgi:phytoene dehydrogenase-like protein
VDTGAEVSRIVVEEGRVTGVAVADAGEVHAPVVVSCLDPKTTFLRLVEPSHLEPSFLRAVANLRARGTVGVVHYALDRLPHFTGTPEGGGELAGRVLIGDTVDRLEQAFDDAKYGRVPERPHLDLTFPSIADPTMAPGEHHVLAAWVQYPPHRLREGSWEEQRSRLGDAVDRVIEEHAPGFTGTVRHRRVLTPADLEERLGCTGGCLYHLEPALDQFLYLRPLPHWARHATPIRGLYLGGAGTHGGGGLTGLAGRNAARSVLG